MKEWKFTCERCNTQWYATDKSLKDAKSNRRTQSFLKFQRLGIVSVKGYNRIKEQLAEVQTANRDPEACPNCGSHKCFKVLA